MNVVNHSPQLIAHRGYSEYYPENTLAGLKAALEAGASCIEFDVQFSRDGVPMVIHDNELSRTTGVGGKVSETTAEELATICAGEADRFGDRFSEELIPTLVSVLQLLDQWRSAIAFVEIKTETVEFFDAEQVARTMVRMLAPYGDRCVLISFDRSVLESAKKLGVKQTGWVIQQWSNEALQDAQELSPDVLFCNYKKIPDCENPLWPGPWRWALYDVVDPRLALHWFENGAQLIETWNIGGLLADKNLVSYLRGDG